MAALGEENPAEKGISRPVGGQIPSGWDLSELLRLSRIGQRSIRQQILKAANPVEFVAATVCAIANAGDSVSGYLASVLTNPDGAQLDPAYFALAELPPADLIALIEQAIESGCRESGNSAWDSVMPGVNCDRLEDLLLRLLSPGA